MLRTINAELRVETEQRLIEAYQERDHFLETAQALELANHDLRRRYENEFAVRLQMVKAIERYRAGCGAGDPLAPQALADEIGRLAQDLPTDLAFPKQEEGSPQSRRARRPPMARRQEGTPELRNHSGLRSIES